MRYAFPARPPATDAEKQLRAVMDQHCAAAASEQAARVEAYAIAILATTGGRPQDFTLRTWSEWLDGRFCSCYRLEQKGDYDGPLHCGEEGE